MRRAQARRAEAKPRLTLLRKPDLSAFHLSSFIAELGRDVYTMPATGGEIVFAVDSHGALAGEPQFRWLGDDDRDETIIAVADMLDRVEPRHLRLVP